MIDRTHARALSDREEYSQRAMQELARSSSTARCDEQCWRQGRGGGVTCGRCLGRLGYACTHAPGSARHYYQLLASGHVQVRTGAALHWTSICTPASSYMHGPCMHAAFVRIYTRSVPSSPFLLAGSPTLSARLAPGPASGPRDGTPTSYAWPLLYMLVVRRWN